jgi:acetoin utilization deacetylase AcuC-like enzyme
MGTVPAMPVKPLLFSHPSSFEHDTGGHPERAERIAAVMAELEPRGWLGYERVSSPAVERPVLELVHPARYVDAIERVSIAGGGRLDADTLMSSGSFTAAAHACGGAVEMVSRLLGADSPAEAVGFSAHRPPGHHALPERAMGFCLFNSVAVAASWALRGLGLERVLILDWDVHHGNGTNDVFLASNEVLFISIHQSPLYPGTGPASEVGDGAGRGYTVNLPVPPGSGDLVFLSLVGQVVVPLALTFEPQLVLVSAGYDAHLDDPLAGCAVTEAGFAGMAAQVRDLGRRLGVPVGCVLEGGYDLGALSRSVVATMEALADPAAFPVPEPAEVQLAEAARDRIGAFWPALR